MQKQLLASEAIFSLLFTVFSLNFSYAYADHSANEKSHLKPLSTLPFPYGLYFVLILLAIFFIVIIIIVLVRARTTLWKHRKPIGIALLITMAVATSVAFVWSAAPSIQYGVTAADTYPEVSSDNYFTVNCENTGYWAGTFDFEVQLTNGEISAKTTAPHQELDNSTAKFSFTLQAGEKQNTPVYFSIDKNATEFYIYWTFHSSGFLLKSDSLGLTERSYKKKQDSNVFVLRMPPVPP